MKALKETQFAGLTPVARGKVRDIYDLDDKLLIVATDRLSAFDVILPTPIPDKGRVLTQLSPAFAFLVPFVEGCNSQPRPQRHGFSPALRQVQG